ncbi:carcinine hydrolase/isopenicillin-N N-acyltransferase family protein [Marinobacterium aestuariivivens]|uniref:Carcinine hydrolase/isopenicillin-N N-acyltransferase family protein n=1 Tax=Marinobacterium aestuariivivens TaxID=1698799 RepID=A0ABW2A3J5_9GAMM
MTWLLSEADSVERALEMIASVPHAGGGNLVLADPSGARAAVELGHRGTTVERAECDWIARTNHYLSAPLCDSHPEGPLDSIGASSRGRLAHIREIAPGLPDSDGLAPVAALFASHDSDGRTGLCSHPVGDGPRTISTSLYLCRDRALCFSDGNPCLDRWYRFQLA